MKSKRKVYKSIPMFKNPMMEKLSHVHPLTPLICWGPVAVFLMWKTLMMNQINPLTLAGTFVLGVLTWTFTEYVLHRFLFHYVGHSSLTKRIHFYLHGHHHEDGNDPTRLVMTPVISIVIAIILFTVFKGMLGPVLVLPFFAAFVVGYLIYDYTHYYVHFFKPTHKVGIYLKQYHMQHHFAESNSRWGVSSPLWDYVFRTHKEKDA